MNEEHAQSFRSNSRVQRNGQEQGGESSSSSRRRRRRRKKNNSNGGQEAQGNQQHQQQGSQRRNNQHNNNNGGQGQRRKRSNGSNHHHNHGSNQHQAPYRHKTPPEKLGGRDPINPEASFSPDGPLDLEPFELFCTYHLGITENNGYRRPNARDIARRFGVSVDEMHDALRRFSMDNNALKDSGFDMSLARLDIRVAPEGIDRRELARVLFDELLETDESIREACAEQV